MGGEFQFRKMKRFVGWVVVMVCNERMGLMPLNCTPDNDKSGQF